MTVNLPANMTIENRNFTFEETPKADNKPCLKLYCTCMPLSLKFSLYLILLAKRVNGLFSLCIHVDLMWCSGVYLHILLYLYVLMWRRIRPRVAAYLCISTVDILFSSEFLYSG